MLNDTDDINVLVNHWTNIFSLIIDKHAPLCEMSVSEKYCPWIDRDFRGLMRTRGKLKKSAVKTKSAPLLDSYRHVLNKVIALNTKQKKEYYDNKISACQGNIKESWKAINELLNKRSKSSNIGSLKESGSEKLFTGKSFLMQ